MMNTGLGARRAAALRALAQRPASRPSQFPSETQPSGDLPDDPEWAARMLDARLGQIDAGTWPPTTEEPGR